MLRQHNELKTAGASPLLVPEFASRLRLTGLLVVLFAASITAANVIGMFVLAYFSNMTTVQAFILDVVLVLMLQIPILVLLVFRPLTRQNVERQRAVDELKSSRKQLRALMTHTLRAREEERGRIAREIHDELGQILATVQMGVSLLAEDYRDHYRLTARIHDFDLLLVDAIKTVQRIAAELRPRMLDLLGLGEAVEWQTKEFEKHTGILCKPVILLQREEFAPDVATAVFRILQEALTNVMRHAGATRVDVTLEERLDRLALIIRDNGKGIRREELNNSTSLGILGMKERAFALGGRVRIHCTPRQGTIVVAHIPVRQNRRA